MQKYKQIKNNELVNFLQNNQICIIKKESKKYNKIASVGDSNKIFTKKKIKMKERNNNTF